MSLNESPANWFDIIAIIILLLGLRKGRAAGMSEEWLRTIQWLIIIVAGAFLYRPAGDWLAKTSPISHVLCYVTVYVLAGIVTKTIFESVKKVWDAKWKKPDTFGSAEYYLGMIAGAVRYSCMLIAGLALLNAPSYSSQEISAKKASNIEVYGNTYFPEFSSIQQDVFKGSLLGSLVKNQAGILLIASNKDGTPKRSKITKTNLP